MDGNVKLEKICFERSLNRLDRVDVGLFVISIIFNVSLKTFNLWFCKSKLYPTFIETLRLFAEEDCRTEVRSLLSEVVLLLNLSKELRNLLMTVVRAVLFIATISLILLSCRENIKWRARKKIKYNRMIFVSCLIGSLFAAEGISNYIWIFRFDFYRFTTILVSCQSSEQLENFNQLQLYKKVGLFMELSLLLSLIMELIICCFTLYRSYGNHDIHKSFYRWHKSISYRRFCRRFNEGSGRRMIRKRLKKLHIRVPVKKRRQKRRRQKYIDKKKVNDTMTQRLERYKLKRSKNMKFLKKKILGTSRPKDFTYERDVFWSSKTLRIRQKKRLIKAKIRQNQKGYRYLKHRRKHEKRLRTKYEPKFFSKVLKKGPLRYLYKSKFCKNIRYSFRKSKFLLKKKLTPLRKQYRRITSLSKSLMMRLCIPCFICCEIFLRHTVIYTSFKSIRKYFQRFLKQLHRIKLRFIRRIYSWSQNFPIISYLLEKIPINWKKYIYDRRIKRKKKKLHNFRYTRRHPHLKINDKQTISN